MYVRNEIRPSIILWFCWKHVVFFFLYSLVVFVCFHKIGWKFVSIPFLPVGTIGTAVAFYVGFKNNASYERLWEGRKIWGAIANLSKAFALITCGLSDVDPELQQQLVRRQISWSKLLSLQLRETIALRNRHKTPPEVALVQKVYGQRFQRESTKEFLSTGVSSADRKALHGASNPALKLLEIQTKDSLRFATGIDHSSEVRERMLEILVECVKEQGAAERLKNFPFPRQYAHFSNIFVWIFLLLLPFGLVDELTKVTTADWLIVPFSTLISWMFITMEQVGDSSEDPFEMGLNDVPLTEICRNIEIDLLSMLDVKDLPEPVLAVGDILL